MDYRALIEACMVSRMVWRAVYGRILPLLIVRGRSHLDHVDQWR